MRQLLALALMLTTVACGRDSAGLGDSGEFPSDFEISVSSGTSPTISWPGGAAAGFSVDDISGRTLTQASVWSFSAVNANTGFASPVKYGTVPQGYRCGILDDPCPAARPLERGIRYMIMVFRVDGQIGVKIFTP